MKNIGLFGGTFDPIHQGHLHIAQAFAEQCQLDCVIFLPAGDPYHKNAPRTAAAHRLAMVERAIADFPQFAASDCDMVRTGETYTIDTISIFRQHYPKAQLHWLMGMDSLMNLHTWKNWQALVKQIKISVANRDSVSLAHTPPALRDWLGEAVQNGSLKLLDTPPLSVSSSEIRASIAAGKNMAAQLPESVWQYIQENHLYQ